MSAAAIAGGDSRLAAFGSPPRPGATQGRVVAAAPRMRDRDPRRNWPRKRTPPDEAAGAARPRFISRRWKDALGRSTHPGSSGHAGKNAGRRGCGLVARGSVLRARGGAAGADERGARRV